MEKVLEYLLGALLALIGLVWGDNKRRISILEGALEKKADSEDVQRHQEHIIKLFDQHKDIVHEMNSGFTAITRQIHDGQMMIMKELSGKADKS